MKLQAGTIVWRMSRDGIIFAPIKVLKIESDSIYYYNMFAGNKIIVKNKSDFTKIIKSTVPYVSNYDYKSVTIQEKMMLIDYANKTKNIEQQTFGW